MYDANWTRSIVRKFRKIRTRTEKSDAFLIGRATELLLDIPYIGALGIEELLVWGLQRNSPGWAVYKAWYKAFCEVDTRKVIEDAPKVLEYLKKWTWELVEHSQQIDAIENT